MVFCHLLPTLIHSAVPEPSLKGDAFSPSFGALQHGYCLRLSWVHQAFCALQVRLNAARLCLPCVNLKTELLHPEGPVPSTPLVNRNHPLQVLPFPALAHSQLGTCHICTDPHLVDCLASMAT